MKSFHHDLPRERGGDGRIEPAGDQRDSEKLRGDRLAEQRRDQPMRFAEFGDFGVTARVEHRRRQHQDRAIDEQREKQRQRAVDHGEADGLALLARRDPHGARLHHEGVQEEIMRHHRRAENAETEIEHLRIGEEARRRDQPARDGGPFRARHHELRGEAEADEAEHRHDEKLDLAKAQPLESENEKRIEHRGEIPSASGRPKRS